MLFHGKTSKSLNILPLFKTEPYNWTADITAVSISGTVAGNFCPTHDRSSNFLAVALWKPAIRSATPQRGKSPATQFSQSSRPWAETGRRNYTRLVLILWTWGARRRLIKSLAAPIAISDWTWRSWRQKRLLSLWASKTHSGEELACGCVLPRKSSFHIVIKPRWQRR